MAVSFGQQSAIVDGFGVRSRSKHTTAHPSLLFEQGQQFGSFFALGAFETLYPLLRRTFSRCAALRRADRCIS